VEVLRLPDGHCVGVQLVWPGSSHASENDLVRSNVDSDPDRGWVLEAGLVQETMQRWPCEANVRVATRVRNDRHFRPSRRRRRIVQESDVEAMGNRCRCCVTQARSEHLVNATDAEPAGGIDGSVADVAGLAVVVGG
jgi:hypothetical protein